MWAAYYIHERYLREAGFYDSIIKIKSDAPALLNPIVSMDKPCLKLHYEFTKTTVYISVNKHELLVEVEGVVDNKTVDVRSFPPCMYDTEDNLRTLLATIIDNGCHISKGGQIC